MGNMKSLAIVGALILFAAPALAQQQMPSPTRPPPDPIVTAYQLGLQTGQQIAAMASGASEQLKWWGECVKDADCVAWVTSTPRTPEATK